MGGTWWGMLGLGLKGALWIGFAGAFLGMGLSGVRYRAREMAMVLGGLLILMLAGIWVLNLPFDPANRILPRIYFSARLALVSGGGRGTEAATRVLGRIPLCAGRSGVLPGLVSKGSSGAEHGALGLSGRSWFSDRAIAAGVACMAPDFFKRCPRQPRHGDQLVELHGDDFRPGAGGGSGLWVVAEPATNRGAGWTWRSDYETFSGICFAGVHVPLLCLWEFADRWTA